MPDEDVVDTMGDYMMEAMELKYGKICDESYSSCGGEHAMDDDNYSLYDDIEKKYYGLNIYMDTSQRGLVVQAKYFGISHARGHRFRTAVSKS